MVGENSWMFGENVRHNITNSIQQNQKNSKHYKQTAIFYILSHLVTYKCYGRYLGTRQWMTVNPIKNN